MDLASELRRAEAREEAEANRREIRRMEREERRHRAGQAERAFIEQQSLIVDHHPSQGRAPSSPISFDPSPNLDRTCNKKYNAAAPDTRGQEQPTRSPGEPTITTSTIEADLESRSAGIIPIVPHGLRRRSGVLDRWMTSKWLLPKLFAVYLSCITIVQISSYSSSIVCRVPGVPLFYARGSSMAVTNVTNNSSDEHSHILIIAHINELFSNVVHEAAPLQNLPYEIERTQLGFRNVSFTIEVSSLPWPEKEQALNDFAECTYTSDYIMSMLRRYTANLLMTIDRVLLYTERTVGELHRLDGTNTPDTYPAAEFFWIKNNFARLALGLSSRNVTAARFAAARIEKHIEDVERDRTCLIEDATYMLEDFASLRKSVAKLRQVMGVVTKLTDDKRTPPKLHHWFYVALWTLFGHKSEHPGEEKDDIPQSLERIISGGKRSVENILTEGFEIGQETLVLQDIVKRSGDRWTFDAEDTVRLSAGVDVLRKLLEDERRRIAEIPVTMS